ncbi:MAG: hypothetical protein WCI94_02180 [Rhodospirillales bacterium]
MIRLGLAAALFVGMTTVAAFAQIAPQSSAATTVPPYVPDPGRSGQMYLLPQGGQGVTFGGTPYFQMLGTPGGAAIAIPNGNGTSTVLVPGMPSSTIVSPR